MAKVRHLHKRGGAISVCGTRYELDQSGCATVSDEHAAIMLKGANWRLVEATPSRPEPKAAAKPDLPAAPPAEEHPAEKPLGDMLKTELLELAKGMGLEVDGKMSKLNLAALIRKARKER